MDHRDVLRAQERPGHQHRPGAAALSQYLVNIVDFRDTDGVITKFTNPDVWMTPPSRRTAAADRHGVPPASPPPGAVPLVQFGMEYNPIAMNEVLAYEFTPAPRGIGDGWAYDSTQRLFIELVNTLTDSAYADATGNTASDLDL